MAINTRNKRKLICQNKTYYWYVKPNYDDMWLTGKMLQLHIFSEDLSWQVFPAGFLPAPGETGCSMYSAGSAAGYRYAGDRPADH